MHNYQFYYIYRNIYNNSNVTMVFHLDVPKYLNYIIQIFACLCETSMPHSNSDTFPQTVLEPRKERRLYFRSAKQTLVLIQFMVIDFDKFLLSDIN